MKNIRIVAFGLITVAAYYATTVYAQAPATPAADPMAAAAPATTNPSPPSGDMGAAPPPPPPSGDMGAAPPPPPPPPGGGMAPPPLPPSANAMRDLVHIPRTEYDTLIRASATSAALAKPMVDEMDIGKMVGDFAPLIALLLIPLILMVKYKSEQRAAALLLDEYSCRTVIENLASDLRATQERQAALMNTIVAALELQGKIKVAPPAAPAPTVAPAAVPPPAETI